MAQLYPELAAGVPRQCPGARLPVDSGSDPQGDAEGRARARCRYGRSCGAPDARGPPGGAAHPEFLGNSSAPGHRSPSLYRGWRSAAEVFECIYSSDKTDLFLVC